MAMAQDHATQSELCPAIPSSVSSPMPPAPAAMLLRREAAAAAMLLRREAREEAAELRLRGSRHRTLYEILFGCNEIKRGASIHDDR